MSFVNIRGERVASLLVSIVTIVTRIKQAARKPITLPSLENSATNSFKHTTFKDVEMKDQLMATLQITIIF